MFLYNIWMEHILAGSGLYGQNLLSQWRQDVKPEAWAENNPLVKAVRSIHLWTRKKAFCTPPDSQPPAPGHLNTHTLTVQTHTHTHTSTHIQECFAWIWDPHIDVRPPAPSVLSASVCDGDCSVCMCVEFCWDVCVCVCATHAANTLQHLGRSLHRLGNGWSENTHLASSLLKDREEEEERVRKKEGRVEVTRKRGGSNEQN